MSGMSKSEIESFITQLSDPWKDFDTRKLILSLFIENASVKDGVISDTLIFLQEFSIILLEPTPLDTLQESLQKELFQIALCVANESNILKDFIILLTQPDKNLCSLYDHCDRMAKVLPLLINYWEENYLPLWDYAQASLLLIDNDLSFCDALEIKKAIEENLIPEKVQENLLSIPYVFNAEFPNNRAFFEAWQNLLNHPGHLLASTDGRDGGPFSTKMLNASQGRGFESLMTNFPIAAHAIHSYPHFLVTNSHWEMLITCLQHQGTLPWILNETGQVFNVLSSRIKTPKPEDFHKYLAFRAYLNIKHKYQHSVRHTDNPLFLRQIDMLIRVQEDFRTPECILGKLLETACEQTEPLFNKAENFAARFSKNAEVLDYLTPFSSGESELLKPKQVTLLFKALACFLHDGFPHPEPVLWDITGPDNIRITSESALINSIFNTADPVGKIAYFYLSDGTTSTFYTKSAVPIMNGELYTPPASKKINRGEIVFISLVTLHALKTQNEPVLDWLLTPNNPHIEYPEHVINAILDHASFPITDPLWILSFLEKTWMKNFFGPTQQLNAFLHLLPATDNLELELLETLRIFLENIFKKIQLPCKIIEKFSPFLGSDPTSPISLLLQTMIQKRLIAEPESHKPIFSRIVSLKNQTVEALSSFASASKFIRSIMYSDYCTPLLVETNPIHQHIEDLMLFHRYWTLPDGFIQLLLDNIDHIARSDITTPLLPRTPTALVLQMRTSDSSSELDPISLDIQALQSLIRFFHIDTLYDPIKFHTEKTKKHLVLDTKNLTSHYALDEAPTPNLAIIVRQLLPEHEPGLLHGNSHKLWIAIGEGDRHNQIRTLTKTAGSINNTGQRYEALVCLFEQAGARDFVDLLAPEDDPDFLLTKIKFLMEALCVYHSINLDIPTGTHNTATVIRGACNRDFTPAEGITLHPPI